MAASSDLNIILESSLVFTKSLTSSEIINHALNCLVRVSGAQSGVYIAVSNDGQETSMIASSDGERVYTHTKGVPDGIKRLPSQKVIEKVRSRRCAAVDEHSTLQDNQSAKSTLLLPISSATDVLAIIYLRHDDITDLFGEERVELLTILASQAAAALEKSKIYDELTFANQELSRSKALLESQKQELEKEVKLRLAQLTDQNGALSREIQQRKDMENELVVAKETAETATAMKSRFLAMMSHEMRTPFNSVIGFSTLLLDTKLTTEQQDMAQSIVNSSSDLITLINDILDFSKIESDKMSLDPIWFDARTLVESTLEVIYRPASEKNLDLAYFEKPNTAANWIFADNSRLRQCLLNLLSNAVKFTPEKGVVTIETYLKDVEQVPGSGNVRTMLYAVVKDNGIGIAEADKAKLFQFFSQVDDSTTRRFGGTGLGLAISQKICRLFKGDLTCESELGKGSTFTASFEVEYNRKTRPSEVISSKVLQGKTCLILEPSPTLRNVLKQHIKFFKIKTICRSALDEIDSVTDQCDLAIIGDTFNQPETIIALRRRGISILRLPLVVLMPFGATMPQQPTDQDLESIDAVVSTPVRRLRLFRSLESLYPAETGVQPFAKPTQQNLKTITNPGESFPRKDISILLVEDNLVNVKVATQLLKRLGYLPTVAHDGLEAVSAHASEHYDLILMDLSMPRMGGLEATREIRSAQEGRRPAFICAMTANAMSGDRERCIAAGMDDYISKPVMMPKLKLILDKVRDIVTGTIEGNRQIEHVDHTKQRNSLDIEREERSRRSSMHSLVEEAIEATP